jgi:hypothetical protein
MKNVTPSSDTAAFMREVDEALQVERLLALWHRSKWLLLSGVLALVLGVAGWQAWQAWQRHTQRTQAAQWYAFTQTPKATQHEALLKMLPNTAGGVRALALMQLAQQATTPAEKAKAYLQITTPEFPLWLAQLARLNAAMALVGTDVTAAKTHLEVLAQRDPLAPIASPAYAPAVELLALIAMQQNDLPTARAYTQKLLAEQQLPDDLRQRAVQRLGYLGSLPNK